MRKSKELSPGMIVLLALVGPLVAGILLLGLLYGILLCWAGVTDLKNYYIARTKIDPQATAYIVQTYPDNDFVVGDAYYAFKDNCYRVKVHSPSSQDTHFYLNYDYKTYKLTKDFYESEVLSGWNTFERLEEEYAALMEEALSSITYLSYRRSNFCQYSENSYSTGGFSPEGLDMGTLILDKDYNVGALGVQYGELDVTAILPAEKVNISSALEVMREIDQQLAKGNVGYYLMKITLQDASFLDYTVQFTLYGVHPEDLHREDALTYLQELWNEQEARRQERKNQRDNE